MNTDGQDTELTEQYRILIFEIIADLRLET